MSKIKSDPKRSRVFFLVLFAAITYVSYLVLKPYLSLVVIAFLTVLFFYPLYEKILKISKGKTSIAVPITIVNILAIIIIPLLLFANLIINQAIKFNDDISEVVAGEDLTYDEVLSKTNEILDKTPLSEYEIKDENVRDFVANTLKPIGSFLLDKVINVGTSSFSLIPNIIVFITILASLFPAKDKIINLVRSLSPLDDDVDDIYLRRVIAMSLSMIKGTFIIAIVQGLLSGILMYGLGVPYAVFWAIVIIFASIIPVGAGIVLIPMGIVYIILGDVAQGIALILFYILVISNIDNFLRPRLVSKDASLHPALTLLGVLGGIQFFGFFGIIYGPVILIFLVTTIEVYMKYYAKNEEVIERK